MEKPTWVHFQLRTFACQEIDDILQASSNARNLDKRTRDKYLAAMLNGQWDSGNGDTLVFDVNKHLIDGQHRLSAAQLYQEQTQEQVWFWCAMNCNQQASLSKDQGKVRRLGELLQRQNVPNYSTIPGLVRSQMVLREQGYKIQAIRSSVMTATLAQQYLYFQLHADELQHMSTISTQAQKAQLANASLFAQVVYEIFRRNGSMAIAFADAVLDFKPKHDNDPALLLRVKLNKSYRNPHSTLTRDHTIVYTVKAWNAWSAGETMKLLRWSAAGPQAEDWPEIRVLDSVDDE